MTTKTHTYLVNGSYQVKHVNGLESTKENGRHLVQADSELKAIMAAAREFTAGQNLAMFTWLKVKAERIDN
ncbi:MAG: hypothetical protein H6658_02520 [Ardenticatenaceae bacterium]|nr:hypothetical protein [Ardenticatenaceae bacterium]